MPQANDTTRCNLMPLDRAAYGELLRALRGEGRGDRSVL
jgi:hypothetical protein